MTSRCLPRVMSAALIGLSIMALSSSAYAQCTATSGVQFTGSLEDGLQIGVPEPKQGKFTIAYSNGLDLAEPLHIEGIAAKLEAEKLGGSFITSDAQGSPDRQLTQILQFIDQGVDGIMVAVLDPNALRPALEKAKEAGIPIIGTEINLENLEPGEGWLAQIWPGRDLASYLQVKAASELMPCDGEFVSMNFVVKIPIIEYVVKREAYWGEKFGLKQVGVAAATSDDSAGGEVAMTQLLGQNPDLDAAIIYTDSVATGARSAARSAGLLDLPVIGGNGGNGGFEAVEAGRLNATVQVNYPAVGRLAVWALYNELQGGPKAPRTFLTPRPVVVTGANISEHSNWNKQLEDRYGTSK